jgi:hypothetical protein
VKSLAFGSLPRGKQPVSPASLLPSSAGDFATGVREWFHSEPLGAAPVMPVAATTNSTGVGRMMP